MAAVFSETTAVCKLNNESGMRFPEFPRMHRELKGKNKKDIITASPPFFYNNTNNYIIIKIKYLLELKIKLKNYNILIWHYIRF